MANDRNKKNRSIQASTNVFLTSFSLGSYNDNWQLDWIVFSSLRIQEFEETEAKAWLITRIVRKCPQKVAFFQNQPNHLIRISEPIYYLFYKQQFKYFFRVQNCSNCDYRLLSQFLAWKFICWGTSTPKRTFDPYAVVIKKGQREGLASLNQLFLWETF